MQPHTGKLDLAKNRFLYPRNIALLCVVTSVLSCKYSFRAGDVNDKSLQNSDFLKTHNKNSAKVSTVNMCGVGSSNQTTPASDISLLVGPELTVGADGCPHIVYRPMPEGSKLKLASFNGEKWYTESIPNSAGAHSLDIWIESEDQVVVAWSNPKEKVMRLGVRRAPNDWIIQDILNDWIWNVQRFETNWHDRALMVYRSDEKRSIKNGRIHMLVEDDNVWRMHSIANDIFPETAFTTKQLALDPETGQAIIFLSSYYVPPNSKPLGNLWIARSEPESLTHWETERTPPTGLTQDKIFGGYVDRDGLMHVFAEENGLGGLGAKPNQLYYISNSPSQGWTVNLFPGCKPAYCNIHSIHVKSHDIIDVFYHYDETPSTRDTALMWARYDSHRWRTAMIETIADHSIVSVAYDLDSTSAVHILLQQRVDSPTHHTVLTHRLLTTAEL